MEQTKSFVVDVKEHVDGSHYIEFPDDVMKDLGWKEGDNITWTDNHDGSYTLAKKATQWVLVEAISTFRMRYMVEVPIGQDEWALDTVVMEEATEFSQKPLGETIVSHRVVSFDEAIQLCDEDNQYSKDWNEEKKREAFFTEME